MVFLNRPNLFAIFLPYAGKSVGNEAFFDQGPSLPVIKVSFYARDLAHKIGP